MVINWYGEGSFKIQTGGVSMLTDPFESSTGLTPARGKNEIILKTLTPWPIKREDKKDSAIVCGGGEYEIQGIEIDGFPLPKDSTEKFFKTAYSVTAENIKLGFLGHLSGELTPDAMQGLKNSDILFIPAGGKPFINQEAAAKLLKQLGPKIIIASFFKIPGLKRQSADFKSFANETDLKPEIMEKLTIRKKEITDQKGLKLVILKI